MKTTLLKRTTALLLCLILSSGVMLPAGAAYAADADAISAQILLPADWAAQSTFAKICIIDEAGNGFSSVQVKVEGGNWKDITNDLEQRDSRCYGVVNISDNCTVYVRVTGQDGKIYENSRYIECFDRTPPTVKGHISGDTLKVECSDDLSGVTEVLVAGKSFTYPATGTLSVPLKNIGSVAQISLQATDRAGNTSQPVSIKNTGYQKPAASSPQLVSASTQATNTKPTTSVVKPDADEKPSVSAIPVSEEPTNRTDSSKTLTPNGQGTVMDNVTDEDGKEFFTVSTKDDNTFYLIIDKARDSENVYLLDTVKESDLLSMAEKDKKTDDSSQSAIPEPEPVCSCKEKCAPGEVNTGCPVCAISMKDCTGRTPEPAEDTETEPKKQEKSNTGTLILALFAALAAGGIGWYFKIYKPKKALDDAEDFDELIDDGEEEMVNEDDAPEPERDPYGEPDEPDYPDDYYGEPEDEP